MPVMVRADCVIDGRDVECHPSEEQVLDDAVPFLLSDIVWFLVLIVHNSSFLSFLMFIIYYKHNPFAIPFVLFLVVF